MNNQPNIATLSKSDLLSEINALNFVDDWVNDWTINDVEYRMNLETEYCRRIEDDCELITKEE